MNNEKSRAHWIYPIEKRIQKELIRIENDPLNKQILTRYYKTRKTRVQMATLLNEINRLNIMSKMLKKKFSSATRWDIEDLVSRIDENSEKPATYNKYCTILKIFYQWYKGYLPKTYPSIVRSIRLKTVPAITVTEDDLVPYEEIIRVCQYANNLRDRTWPQCKLDAGCRIGQILTPTIKDVCFTQFGAKIQTVDGKTGKRPIILTWSAKLLSTWLDNHPFRDDPDAPLWSNLFCKKPRYMQYATAYKAFLKMIKKSNAPKKMWLHLIKHVSVTHDGEMGMPDSHLKYKHGWSASSNMPRVYSHLCSNIIPIIQEQSMQKMGIHRQNNKVKEDRKDEELQLQPASNILKKCGRCSYDAPSISAYCNRCGFPLDEKNLVQSSVKQTILEDMAARMRNVDPKKIAEIEKILNNQQ